MRFRNHFGSTCAAIFSSAMLMGPGQAGAELRLVELTVESGEDYALEDRAALPPLALQSVVKMDISARLNSPQEYVPFEEIPIGVQKNGISRETYTGGSSDTAPWEGTMRVVVDLENDILQLADTLISPKTTGAYCPGIPNNKANECPESEQDPEHGHSPGQLAYTLAPEGVGGSAAVAIRQGLGNINGISTIDNGVIDTQNWHVFIIDTLASIDGTGVVNGGQPGGIHKYNQRFRFPNRAAHNERDTEEDAATVPDSTFLGSFAVNGQDVTMTIPAHIPALFTDTPDEPLGDDQSYVRLLFTGEILATGVLGDVLTPGDHNNDGVVNGLDVNIISRNYGKGEDHEHDPDQRELHSLAHAKYQSFFEGDSNLDTIVDDIDLQMLIANYGGAGSGAGAAATSAVPEPSSLLLALLAGTALIGASRRRCQAPPRGVGWGYGDLRSPR